MYPVRRAPRPGRTASSAVNSSLDHLRWKVVIGMPTFMLISLLLVPPVISETHFLNDFFMIIWCGKNDDAEKGSLFRHDTTDWFSDSITVQIKGISANNLCSNLLDRAKFECIRSSYASGLLLRDDSAFHQRLVPRQSPHRSPNRQHQIDDELSHTGYQSSAKHD